MNQIGLYLKKIHILLERRRNYEYRDYNLTSTQIDILEYLYFNSDGKNTLSDIAAFFGVQHTSVIHVLKILEKKELIHRRESSLDSRCKAILLTQKGFTIMKSHLGCPASQESRLCADIPEKDLEILEKSLRQIYQNLQRNQPANTKDTETKS
ncbi:transcriptional regulator SlyA [Lachnospiraceae bacterium]|nr:transcriptional regulator SlyA [Lachnospiraceae bacterium]